MAQQEVGYGGRVEAEVAERPVGLDCPYRFMTRKIEFIGGGRYLFVVVKRIVAVGARICYLGRAVGVEEVVEIGADSAFFDAFGVDVVAVHAYGVWCCRNGLFDGILHGVAVVDSDSEDGRHAVTGRIGARSADGGEAGFERVYGAVGVYGEYVRGIAAPQHVGATRYERLLRIGTALIYTRGGVFHSCAADLHGEWSVYGDFCHGDALDHLYRPGVGGLGGVDAGDGHALVAKCAHGYLEGAFAGVAVVFEPFGKQIGRVIGEIHTVGRGDQVVALFVAGKLVVGEYKCHLTVRLNTASVVYARIAEHVVNLCIGPFVGRGHGEVDRMEMAFVEDQALTLRYDAVGVCIP